MRNQRLQGRITAGRFTLPIVIFTCIACWVLTSVLLPGLEVKESSYPLWNIVNIPAWANRIVSFLLFAGIGYFLIGMSYSKLMGGLHKADIEINRKVLADLAVNHPEAFKAVVAKAKVA